MFRLGANENPSDFVRRRFCGAECARIDLIFTTTAIDIKKPASKPLVKPTARPMREPKKRNKPEIEPPIVAIDEEPVVEITTPTRTWRTWARAKWEGPSEEVYIAAERYGRMHRLTAEEVLRLWGYQKTEIVELKPKEITDERTKRLRSN